MDNSRREGAAYSRSGSKSDARFRSRARDDQTSCTEDSNHAHKRRHTRELDPQNRRYQKHTRSSESLVASRLRSRRTSKTPRNLSSSKSPPKRKIRKHYGSRREPDSLSSSRPRLSSKSYSHCSRRSRRDTYRRYERESLEMNRNGRRKRSFSRSFSMRSRSPRDDIKASGSARHRTRASRSRRNGSYRNRIRTDRHRERSRQRKKRGKRYNEKRAKQEWSGDVKDASDGSGAQDDTIGRFEGKPGDYISSRYKIIREAGLGTFGRVLECLDKQRDRAVAIKVVRRVEKYTESAKIEARILQDLNEMDYFHESLCVRMYKWFEYKGHVCMVFERLGCSLYDYLKNHDYKPFPLESIRAYAWQLLVALDYIHNIKLIHTDLKPENILLVDGTESKVTSASRSPLGSDSVDQCDRGRLGSRHRSKDSVYAKSDAGGRRTLTPPACNAVKLIDFGGATYDDESKSQIINTRQYRSPEVILGLGWSFASDIWSAGCIIAELYLGDLLFATHDNMEHLALMEACIGKLPHHMVAHACRKQPSDGFFHRGRLAWPQKAATKESVHHVRRMRTLREIVTQDHAKLGLLDLLKQMLVLDPHHRVSAKEALRHPFFDGFSRRDISRPVDRDSEHSSNRRKRGIWR